VESTKVRTVLAQFITKFVNEMHYFMPLALSRGLQPVSGPEPSLMLRREREREREHLFAKKVTHNKVTRRRLLQITVTQLVTATIKSNSSSIARNCVSYMYVHLHDGGVSFHYYS